MWDILCGRGDLMRLQNVSTSVSLGSPRRLIEVETVLVFANLLHVRGPYYLVIQSAFEPTGLFNSLPDDTFLDQCKLKQIADEFLKCI